MATPLPGVAYYRRRADAMWVELFQTTEKSRLFYLFFIPFQSSFKREDKMTEFSGAHERWKKRRVEMRRAREEERAEHEINNKLEL